MKKNETKIKMILIKILIVLLYIIAILFIGKVNKVIVSKKSYNNQKILNKQISECIEKEKLLENTKDIEAGTIVKLPDAWQIEKTNNELAENGVEIISSKKVANVYAVSAGNGETVPVPVGFWYVGGDLSTGVVISDNKNDKDKYAKVTDESGKAYVGIDLEGNQFVWIPCTESEYKKCNTWDGKTQYYTSNGDNLLANANWDTIINSAETIQIRKYGGFYVGRYEAGLATTIKEYTNEQQTTSNQIYNLEGKPQSKAGKIPWIFIDWTTSQKNAKSMYNTSYVNSGLITGTQWDVMINKITNVEGKSLTDSKAWGNYYNSSLTYTGRYATYNSSTEKLSVFSETQTGETKNKDEYILLTTGASEQTKAYNLYDVAGNIWEWTEETSLFEGNSATQYKEFRSGSSYDESKTYPVCFRNGNLTINTTFLSVGFRVVLYIN